MYSHAIFCSTVVKVRLLWPVSHIFTVVCCKFYYFQNFNAGKCSKCLKWALLSVLSKITVSQVCLKVFPCNFLLNSGESQVTLTSFAQFTVVCCIFNYFINFNSWKMLKMLKIGCFKQNYCISGMPQGIPMQFFAQQWWKSGYCDQFHTYSQWFAVNLIISKISIAGKCSKCLK